MRIELFAHPFSSYCQKAITAFYENGTAFDLRMLEPGGAAFAELSSIWPIGKFPVLREGERVVPEATMIIEYLDLHHPGTVRFVPADPDAALEVRTLDRFFDNYISTPQQALVFDRIRPEGERDPRGVAEARALLDKAYAWLDARMAGREWAAGDFSLADCAAGPMLFYADWSHPMDGRFPNVAAYRQRLMERPAFKRAIDEARPYRSFFPGGAPDRD
jgi:glutathione S-transferase